MPTVLSFMRSTGAPRFQTRTRAMWRSRLGSALRTTLACTIVGFITLYGPPSLRHHISFPSLSYVVVILLVTEATLGDTVRGCWNALYATMQGVLPAMFALWLVGPSRFSSITATALAVTITAFFVALPLSTHVIAKRVIMVQTVVIYTFTSFNYSDPTAAVVHPLHVAASTAVGALASFLALLLPYPRLASCEVTKKGRLFNKNASERLKLYVKAFCAENNGTAVGYVSRAESLAKEGSKLLESVKLKQDSMQWERPDCIFSQPHSMSPSDRLQALEAPLKGMEIALTSCASIPVGVADQDLKTLLKTLEEHIHKTLNQPNSIVPSELEHEKKGQVLDKPLQALHAMFPITKNDLPSFFFLFCIKLIHKRLISHNHHQHQPTVIQDQSPNKSQGNKDDESCINRRIRSMMRISNDRLIVALKCSLSLGFSVLFGMIFSKEYSCWSGLAVAVGMAFGREATFKSANLKAQGTVLGSIYGVVSCFVFQRLSQIRFLSLLPWIIFTSFLRLSRMFGQAGSASAVIGALIILGRKNYGPASDFAIVRITETFIGLACSITVELLLQPTRASSLAKIQLSNTLGALHSCIESISLCANREEAKEKEKKLRINLGKLTKFIGEADDEPNFWFLPFNGPCYKKLHRSLMKMADLLLFMAHATGYLAQDTQMYQGCTWNDLQKHLDGDLNHFKKMVSNSMSCLEKITLIKSLANLEKELRRGNNTDSGVCDLELGKSPSASAFRVFTSANEDETEKIVSSFLQHSREVIDKIEAMDWEEEKLKGHMVLSLSAIGFCMGALMKQAKEIQKSVRELIQWENPCSQVNDLYEIYYKVNALYSQIVN